MERMAEARIRGQNGLRGRVRFIPRRRGVLVVAEICGLPDSEDGFFGLHIHERGDCSGEGFLNTGSHFDPRGETHPRHAGDLPPLLSCGGEAYLAVRTDRFCIREILGRSVVIHSHPDDFKSQPAGDAGSRIGCGIIQII